MSPPLNAIDAAAARMLTALRAANGATVTHAALLEVLGAEAYRMNEVVHALRCLVKVPRCSRTKGPLFAVRGVGYRLEAAP